MCIIFLCSALSQTIQNLGALEVMQGGIIQDTNGVFLDANSQGNEKIVPHHTCMRKHGPCNTNQPSSDGSMYAALKRGIMVTSKHIGRHPI